MVLKAVKSRRAHFNIKMSPCEAVSCPTMITVLKMLDSPLPTRRTVPSLVYSRRPFTPLTTLGWRQIYFPCFLSVFEFDTEISRWQVGKKWCWDESRGVHWWTFILLYAALLVVPHIQDWGFWLKNVRLIFIKDSIKLQLGLCMEGGYYHTYQSDCSSN